MDSQVHRLVPPYMRLFSACQYFGTSQSKLNKYIKERRFRSIKDGGQLLIHVPSAA